jgi:CHRD domain
VEKAVTRRAVAALAALAWVGSAAVAVAAPQTITVPLSGASQVPAVQTPGSGTATLTYDPATRVVTWSIQYQGLTSPVTMAHFHGPASASQNAGVEVWMSHRGASSSPSPITGSATLTSAQAQQFTSGQMYVNVHTKNNPGGEIRGQVPASGT